ncbi:DNA primase [Paludibacter sp. 221]|uniref:DNA primase n=1 Tax=Paludibacter sp. 221 TaxID=2302939 RepID=UPI0013D4BFBB|nr:DNA primase [Paludibacter sp. 221]NDV46449.1 DNA primase [Paludibacter sp. 221]
MIDQATIDRINETARIEEVVSDYVTLRKRGVNMLGLCPFHNEKTPSFTVSPAKGIFKCFGCGKGGNSVHFIMEHEQLSYYDALRFLAKKYNIEIVERELSAEEQAIHSDRESMFLVNEFAQKYFADILHNHIDGKAIGLSYFRERGFRDDIIKKFQLGYCLDDKDRLTRAALKAGYNKEYLIKTGLTLENETNQSLYDRFRGRVMFPVHSLSGKVIAFGGRILKKDDKKAKYVNSPESEIYHKSNELYGIYYAKQAIVREDRCYLVEGYTDVISMHQSGIENVVASSGTSLTSGQIRLIHRFTENITVIYDGDAAGIKASIRGIDLLLEEGLNVKVLLLPAGEDPDSFAKSNNASDFIEYVQKNSSDFIRFKTSLLLEDTGNDPIKRAGLITDIVRSISLIPNHIIRAEYVKECSTLLNVQEQVLYHEINKLKGKEREKNWSQQQQESIQSINIPNEQQDLKTENIIGAGKFEAEERNILEMLIRYGNHVLYYTDVENKTFKTVGTYILEELESDSIRFLNETYASLLEEYKLHHEEENFVAERFFLHHTDNKISMVAADLIAEKYTLSKVHSKIKKVEPDSERLLELVPRIVFELKNSVIIDQIRQKLLELKEANENKDNEKMAEIMQEMSLLEQVKKQLSKTLGERIIIKL